MKILAVTFLLFITSMFYGQSADMPKIKFYEQSNTINPYVKMLGLTDKNAIIIAPHIISQEEVCSFLVILSDGRMYKFVTKQIGTNTEVRSKEVASDQKPCFLDLIMKMNSLRIFKTNDLEAFNYWKELQKKEKGTIIVIDGPYYSFDIFRNKDIASYGDYSPHSYITNKRPGYELKKEFLRIFEAFDFANEFD